ncbi:hypothetical protein [Escherichia sp. E4385]|uniref:hypothetical protein n=1 Tax=Escherichia sp. E4385 TaxID=2040639 RepID=UPI0010FE4B62|nr:hypothetical protein [Escherichia sp. E4385]TLJ04642.1 hypothetical protein FEK49_01905 [Escherichia sp. E4385]
MQRKVNRSDSDYHYGEEKYKRNVYKMMLECKQREVIPRDINDYSRYKDGIVYNEPCVLARCRVNALSGKNHTTILMLRNTLLKPNKTAAG